MNCAYLVHQVDTLETLVVLCTIFIVVCVGIIIGLTFFRPR